MATYKKRGGKPKTKEDKDKALEAQSTTAGVFNTLDEGASKTERWVAANQKNIFIGLATVVVIVLGYIGYQNFIKGPKEKEASIALFQAENHFQAAQNTTAKDSLYMVALNGAQGSKGFLGVIEDYGSTNAGNIARYYAGITYLQTKNYQEAINHLEKFKAKETLTGALAKGNLGDAYAELNNKEQALKHYKAAAAYKANELTTPIYLFKAATVALQLNKKQEALTLLNQIKNDYPNSPEATQIDSLIALAEAGK